MHFHFKRSPHADSLSYHPPVLQAFTHFTVMSQKSIAIHSLSGPPATKVNNTVTSSLLSEHRHKTALLLCHNRTELFIYAVFHKGKTDKAAIQSGQVPVLQPDRLLSQNKRKAQHLSYCSFTYADFIGRRKKKIKKRKKLQY